MIKSILRSFLVNGVALFLASKIVLGFHLPLEWQVLGSVVIAFTFIHLIIAPVLKLILGPLNLLTFGLIGFIVDVALLYGLSIFFKQIYFTDWLFPGLTYSGIIIPIYNFPPIGSTIVSAAIINIIRNVLKYLSS